jgi:hypothetical protein
MKRLILIICLIPIICKAQPGHAPEKLLLEIPKVKIMVLGTFHFDDSGLDDHKNEKPLAMMSAEKQKEIQEIVDQLIRFKPDKIALEFKTLLQPRIDSLYNDYGSGKFQLGKNEIYQLGFRVGEKLGHDKVYGVDANPRWYDFILNMEEQEYENYKNALISKLAIEKPHTRELYPLYQQYYKIKDSLLHVVPLRDYFLKVNSEESIKANHGIYLVDSFKLGIGSDDEDERYFGADMRTAWYNRNLRIFQNIQRILEAGDERVLLIIGYGHLPIIKHCIEYSPEFEWVELSEYLK